MNTLTQILVWCPIQVTLLAMVALVIGALAGRRRPAAGAMIATAALLAVVGMTAASLSPWPNWSVSWDRLPWWKSATSIAARPEPLTLHSGPQLGDQRFDNGEQYDRPIGGYATASQVPAESFFHRIWTGGTGNWVAIVVVLYLAGISVMVARIVFGLRAIGGYRQNSHPITERSLNELADVVRAELSCTREIELRESTRLATPATIGWLRPILLLPADWRTWTEEERHAVLAHEIEHVRRNDFASWMAAQIGVALHFYHPLVHGLANRLRLQQELAADAAAATVVGGQRKYVTTLAAMALRQADEPLAWPASAFLPNSKTFLKRLDMLHRSKSLRGDAPRAVVFLSLTALLLSAVCAAGIRGSVAGEQTALTSSDGNDGAYSRLVALLDQGAVERPAQIQETPVLLKERARRIQTLNNLKQIALAMHNYHATYKHFPPAVVIGRDGKTWHSWRIELLPFLEATSLYQQYRQDEPWDSENNKKVLAQMPDVFRSPFDDPKSTNSGYHVLVGPGTVFEGTDGIRIQDVTDGTSNTLLVVEAKRGIPWTKPDDIPFNSEKPLPELGGFTKGRFAAAMADGAARVFDLEKAKDQLKWLIVRNDGHPIDTNRLGDTSRRGSSSSGAGFNRATNQLKQLALAMHNYHDVHSHFPPAVVMGSDGKTPHSWRVELLPFLDAADLYQQYDQNQPWDSETNKKVLEKMPAVFQSPFGDAKSTASAYYVLAGPGTAFEGSEGIRISEIIDGTSNTILLVEAKRNIPWTKPEDIPFDPNKPMPQLGGFVKGEFLTALADGSVRRLRKERVRDQLKNLIQRNDMQVISWEKIDGGR